MDDFSDESFSPLLLAALQQTRSATCITTAELDLPGPEIVYVNPAYCRMIGRPAEEVIGKTPRIMQGPLTSREVLDRLRSDLEAGRPFVGETVNYRADGDPYFISWRIDPVVDSSGDVTHYVATQEDVTRLRRAERLLAAEQSIDRVVSNLVSQAGDTTSNLDAFSIGLRDAIASLNDYGTVVVTGTVRFGTSAEAFGIGDPPPVGFDLVSSSDGSVQVGDVAGKSWLGCSLTDERAGVEGAVFVTGLDPAEVRFADRPGLSRAAECATQALASLAEYERQRHAAIELQTDLLPQAVPVVDGLDLCARYRPGAFATSVGGDWYDVAAHDGRVVLTIGDMAGSGIRAAADMGRLKLLARVLLERGATAAEVLEALNTFCAEEGLVATALAATIDTERSTISVVSAGHPPPIAARGGTAKVTPLQPGPLLGIGGRPSYEARELVVVEGETWLLYTDGLFEEVSETVDTGIERLARQVAERSGAVDELCDDLIADRVASGSADDIALLAFRVGSSA